MLYIIIIKRKSFTVHRVHIMISKGKENYMYEVKFILRVEFTSFSGDISFAHYIVSDTISVPSSSNVDDLKKFLQSLPEVVLSPETLNEVSGVDVFSICNDVEL